MVKVVEFDNGQGMMFNISAGVGFGQPNRQDDVEFIRLGLCCALYMARRRGLTLAPRWQVVIAAIHAIDLNGPCDQPLVQAIRHFQDVNGETPTGVFLPIPRGGWLERERAPAIVGLQAEIRSFQNREFPRLDLIPNVGRNLAQQVRRLFGMDCLDSYAPTRS